jgi:glycosyltransferase involved in cell wall biosynthesis
MKILLVGEYSRLHNSLKEGLEKLGHDVTIIGTQDGFKALPIDIEVKSRLPKNKFLSYICSVIYRFFRINFFSLENALLWHLELRKLKAFDIVQLYNESIAKTYPSLERRLIALLKKNNKKLFLLSCGIDYTSVKFAQDKKFRYSIMTPFHNNPNLKDKYKFILKKLKSNNYKLHNYLKENVNGIISSDLDYHLPLKGTPRYLGMVPNPVNTKLLPYIELIIGEKIIIFHGINTSSFTRKGNKFFNDALEIIKKNYNDKVEIIETKDLAYEKYIEHYNNCHILLDQVYAYDQGYNALEAMAKGKVVFTGAEKEWLEYYNIGEDTVAINALPDTEQIVKKLEWLINNPKKIIEISRNARHFIEKEHDYMLSAKKYLKLWHEA